MSEDKTTQIFIGKLPPDVSKKDLEYEFKEFGTLKEISIKKGYAFIDFETTEEAEKAIQSKNGETISNQKIVVEFAHAKKEHSSSHPPPFRGRDRRGGRDSYRSNNGYPSDRGDRKGSFGYQRPRGPQKDDVCYKCKKKGHWANECREGNNEESPRREYRRRSESYHGRDREESPRRRYDDDRNPRYNDRYRHSRSRSRSYGERRDSYRERPERYHDYGRNSRDERDERRYRDSRSQSYRNERRRSRSRSYDKKRRSEDKSRSRRYDDRRSKEYSDKNYENKKDESNDQEKKEGKKYDDNRIASQERKEGAVQNDKWTEQDANNVKENW